MKRILRVGCIFFDVLAIGLIPLNLFLLQMPVFFSAIVAGIIMIMNVMIWRQEEEKFVGKISITFINIVIICLALFGSYCNPYWNSYTMRSSHANFYTKSYDTLLTKKEALQDLEYAMHYLKKIHPELIDGVHESIQNQYEEVFRRIQAKEEISVSELSGDIESIFSLFDDAHTFVARKYQEYRYLKQIYEHKQNGEQLVAVNGIEIPELLMMKSELYSYESEKWGARKLGSDLISTEGLDYLGISLEAGVAYTFEIESGEFVTLIYHDSDFVTYEEYLEYNHITKNEEESFVSYKIDSSHNLAILTLNSCKYNNEYKECLQEMFQEVKANKIPYVVVDLRNNGGGNSLVANEFMKYLNVETYQDMSSRRRLGFFMTNEGGGVLNNKIYSDLVFDGEVYLLTSTATFSSAMDFTMLIKDNHLGTTVGEAPGNSANSFGEITYFKLPNSGLYMQISTKKWNRIDQIGAGDFIEPDIPCGNGDAMDTLYNLIESKR